jgi:hypothetical protein
MSGIPSRERHGGRFDARKRRSSGSGAGSGDRVDESEEGIELADLRLLVSKHAQERAALHSSINSKGVAGVFDRQKKDDANQMATAIWTADFADSMGAVRAANAELVTVLAAQISNTTPESAISIMHKERQLDGILLNIVRGQSIHKVPILTAALSIMCEANLVKRAFHDSISYLMKGALMSETWVQKFMAEAAASRPPPNEKMIPGVLVVCFDNLTMNVAYHAMAVGGILAAKQARSSTLARHAA